MQDEGRPIGGRERVEHHEHGLADRVGRHRLLLRVDSGLVPRDRVGQIASQESSRRVPRERSMLSDTRPTTAVSQPPRFSTSRVSVPVSRSQVSWTASSASLKEPSIR